MGTFGLVLFSEASPERVARFVQKVRVDAPEVTIRAVILERRRPKKISARARGVLKRLRKTAYWGYLASRLGNAVASRAATIGFIVLRFVHACPAAVVREPHFTDCDLRTQLQASGIALLITSDFHCPETLEFVRGLTPDLGVIYGTRILKPELFAIPQHGSINIHKRKVPEYRGGGPVGLWEMLAGASEIGITVHRVVTEVDAGAVLATAVLPIEPFDTLETLQLKAAVKGDELLITTVRELACGRSSDAPQLPGGKVFRTPPPWDLRVHQKTIARSRPRLRPKRGRPAWKLVARTVLVLPLVLCRNWYHRLQGKFPVIVLYHHLVSDRPHYMGIPTQEFLRQLRFLKRCYRIVGMAEALDELRKGRVTSPTVVLSFDDGYKDNCMNLLAACEALRCPATLFLCADHIDTGLPFRHDVRRDSGDFLPLGWEDLRELKKAGFTFGSHTCTHFDCSSENEASLEYEIAGSRAKLEKQLGPTPWFAFPWGTPDKISGPALKIATRSYDAVFTACGGANSPARGEALRLGLRCGHPNDIWELELTLQQVLDLRTRSMARLTSKFQKNT